QGLGEQPLHRLVPQGDGDPLLLQVEVELVHQEARDQDQLLIGQGVEDDDLVHPVDELRVEGALDLPHHHLVDPLHRVLQLPGGEPMILLTDCFSMYSDMSKRIRLRSLPKRKAARLRATSVFPTPVGPRNMKEPTGRFGFLRPARVRRMARATALIALSWET